MQNIVEVDSNATLDDCKAYNTFKEFGILTRMNRLIHIALKQHISNGVKLPCL
jgi:hypothetical protein